MKKYFDKKNRLLTCGIILVVVLLVLIVSLCNQDKSYMVYRDDTGSLYAYDGKKSHLISENASTMYYTFGNVSDRYALYRSNDALYVYNAKKKKSTKVMDSVNTYLFNPDDSYVAILDTTGTLYSYRFKGEAEVLDHAVEAIADLSTQQILYKKNGALYVVSFNPNRDDCTKVAENVNIAQLSENGKQVVYTSNDSTLHIYSINQKKDISTVEHVYQVFCDSSSCKRYYYLTSDGSVDLYYANGKKTYLMDDALMGVSFVDTDSKTAIYSKVENLGVTLYLSRSGKQTVLTDSYGFGSFFQVGDSFYYTDESKNVTYLTHNSKKGKVIAEGLSGLVQTEHYLVSVGDTTTIMKGSKVTSVDHKIDATSLVEREGSLYYIDETYSLYRYSGSEKKIADSVSRYVVVGRDVYVLKANEEGYSLYANDKEIASSVREILAPERESE